MEVVVRLLGWRWTWAVEPDEDDEDDEERPPMSATTNTELAPGFTPRPDYWEDEDRGRPGSH